MKKRSKAQRLSLMTKTLVENPFKLFTLQYFSDWFHCAKSTLSEDVTAIEEVFDEEHEGEIISVSGASGGIYYAPYLTEGQIDGIKKELCELLRDYSRVIPGGYVYMNDLFFDPRRLQKLARCFITKFKEIKVDTIVTIETKGIPLAMAIAKDLNVPVAVVRKSARLSEGTTIQMNYVSGSAKSIKTMAMPIRSIRRGSNILLVDDFMKAGGTAKGIIELMREFDAHVVGVAVVLATKEPKKKLVEDYITLAEYGLVDEEKKSIDISPKSW